MIADLLLKHHFCGLPLETGIKIIAVLDLVIQLISDLTNNDTEENLLFNFYFYYMFN